MKTLADNTKVSARSYYFLLDWNDQDNFKYINEKFNEQSLSQLTIEEYKTLFTFAMLAELTALDLSTKK